MPRGSCPDTLLMISQMIVVVIPPRIERTPPAAVALFQKKTAMRADAGTIDSIGRIGGIQYCGEEPDKSKGDCPKNNDHNPGKKDHLFIWEIRIDKALVNVPDN